MKYAKLINDNLSIAPRRLTIDGCVVFNPTDAQYEAAGYLPVLYTDAPVAPDGYYPVSGWDEQGGEIVQVWHFEPSPEPQCYRHKPRNDDDQCKRRSCSDPSDRLFRRGRDQLRDHRS